MTKRILVIDDLKTVRQQIGIRIADAGYEMLEASNGHEALKALADYDDIALALCDVNMPGMDGLEFVETVRKNKRLADLPIVMLTTERHPEMVERAKQARVKGWLVKPFNLETLVAVARKYAGPPR